MAQILEIIKHSNRYLIHHFNFECNDSKIFGNCTGNWTLNKFMSLHDWHQIFDSLNAPIEQYIENPTKRPTQIQQKIHDTNFQLNIAWMKMDANIYPKLFTNIDFSLVFPYVIKVMVSQRSNIDKFNSVIDVPIESTATDISDAIETSPNRKRMPKRNDSAKPQQEPPKRTKMTNGITRKPVQLKECCVRLPQLQFDEHGQVIQQQQQKQPTLLVRNNKRKYGSIAGNQKMHDIEITPIRNGGGSDAGDAICSDDTHEFKFKCSSSSTPIATQNDGTGTVQKQKRRITPARRMTISTPVSSQERKTGSIQFNPRIRLLKMPANVSKLNISATTSTTTKSKRKNRDAVKKSTKINGKIKNAPGKRIIKKKIRSIPNESQLFETPIQHRKQEKAVAADANAATTATDVVAAADSNSSSPAVTIPTTSETDKHDCVEIDVTPAQCSNTIKMEDLDLKLLTEQEIWKSFEDNFELISNLFLNYLKQTDATVKTAGDYEPFDIISLMTTDQFSVMLDILFEKLVKIGEFGEINYDGLFMKSLIPEWILSIFMQRNSFDRKTAIEKIASQKLQSDQNHEQYTSLINIRLDDTVNLTKM